MRKEYGQFVAIDMTLLDSGQLKGNELLVLSVIKAYLPASFPSIATIMKKANLSRNTVFKYLKSLEQKNIIKRLRRIGSSNFYKIHPQLVAAKTFKRVEAAIKKHVDDFNNNIKRLRTKFNTRGSIKNKYTNQPTYVSIPSEKEEISFAEFLKRNPEYKDKINPLLTRAVMQA